MGCFSDKKEKIPLTAKRLGEFAVLLLSAAVIGVLCGVLFIGLLLGATIFGGGSVSVQGLSNFVLNPEVPAGRYRCGVVERTQGCVIYIMNPSRTDKKGKDFYADAARFTGVPESTIQLGNIEYASRIIPPGYIAQINIPSTN